MWSCVSVTILLSFCSMLKSLINIAFSNLAEYLPTITEIASTEYSGPDLEVGILVAIIFLLSYSDFNQNNLDVIWEIRNGKHFCDNAMSYINRESPST